MLGNTENIPWFSSKKTRTLPWSLDLASGQCSCVCYALHVAEFSAKKFIARFYHPLHLPVSPCPTSGYAENYKPLWSVTNLQALAFTHASTILKLSRRGIRQQCSEQQKGWLRKFIDVQGGFVDIKALLVCQHLNTAFTEAFQELHFLTLYFYILI